MKAAASAAKSARHPAALPVPIAAKPAKPTASAASPFNARGVVASPSFELARPLAKGEIEFAVRAHEIAAGQWIASASWILRAGSMPMDAAPLHAGLPRFATRSEAVDDAFSRAMRQVSSQRIAVAERSAWIERAERLRTWMADAVAEVRANDESMPLRGATVIDLFAGGAGGFGMGLASLGASVELACEIDLEAQSVYRANVRPKAMHGDICTLDGKKLRCDILTMGLLCQAFSAAGKGLGFADPKRAAPYRHAMRLLGEIDAKVVVIECARQLMTNGGGADSRVLVDALLAAGYRAQHRVLNAAGFGLPQNRERSFIVATRAGLAADDILGFLFPEESAPTTAVVDIMDAGLPATIPAASIAPKSKSSRSRRARLGLVGCIDGRNSQGYRVYDSKGVGPTLTTSGGGKAPCSGAYAVAGGARALTPREAYRMQGMPEWSSHHVVAKRAMGHAGNAVAVDVARALGRSLYATLSSKANAPEPPEPPEFRAGAPRN